MYFFFKKYITRWEYALIIAVPTLCIFLSKLTVENVGISSTEYVVTYVTKTTYYEPWNEYIHRTCSRTHRCGKSSYTTYYDCSYVEYHSAKYTANLCNGEVISLDRDGYNYFCNKFKTAPVFQEMNRHYYTQDGNAYNVSWDGSFNTICTYTTTESYRDKVRNTDNVFSYPIIKPEQKTKFKLFDYPELKNSYIDLAVLSHVKSAKIDSCNSLLNKYNALIAAKKQVKIWMLIFDDGKRINGKMQEELWKNGNKNEMVICIGLKNGVTTWSHVFSWTDHKLSVVELKDYFSSGHKLSTNDIPYIVDKVNKHFVRKEFKDFEYITVDPSLTAIIISFLISLLSTIGICIYSVKNDYNLEDEDAKHKKY